MFHPTQCTHSCPYDGTVTAIERRPLTHPSGISCLSVVIVPDDDTSPPAPTTDLPASTSSASLDALLATLSTETLIERIRMGGIIGLGGAGFPTATKIRKGEAQNIETLIINGMECEPYITCDDRLMQDHSDEIIRGIEVLNQLLKPTEILLGIEDNKPEAIAAMQRAATASSARIEVVSCPTCYPSGGEKQLIQILTGKEVPSGGFPHQLAILCQNVATVYAIYHAIEERPLTQRSVTISGDGVAQPGNFHVAIGTPIRPLLESCGLTDQPVSVTVGGPMMGFPLKNLESSITKTVNCLIVNKSATSPSQNSPLNCIRCAACSDACPVSLLPQQLYWATQARNFDEAQSLHLFDCIECGCCSYVCPSYLPLVDYYRHAKGTVRNQQREQVKADHARNRHEFRDARLQREKEEKAKKLAAKKAALKAKKANESRAQHESSAVEADKKATIQAAIDRAKARKAAL